jgi:hypothetical protein
VSDQDGVDLDIQTGIIADGQAKVLNVFAVAVARRAGQRQVC